MIKHIDWLFCDKCNGKSPIEITTDHNDDSLKICYEGDMAKCQDCGATGEIYVEGSDNPPTAHVIWSD